MYRWLPIICCLLLTSPASAIVRRDDVADSQYINLGNTFGAAVWINNGCSGSLIAPDWVMTACHCVHNLPTGPNPTFIVGNGSFFPDGLPADSPGAGLLTTGIERIVLNPGWQKSEQLPEFPPGGLGNFNDGVDIALIQLSTPVDTVIPMNRHSGTVGSLVASAPTTDANVHLVGYGKTGTGETGDTIDDGMKRGATNVIDRQGSALNNAQTTYSNNLILVDFDGPTGFGNLWGSRTPTMLEGATDQGDSGGPWVVDGRVAGVTSFGASNQVYGGLAAATAVSPHNDWINSTMGGVNWNNRSMVGYVPFNTASAWGDGRLPASGTSVQFSLPYMPTIPYGAPYISFTQNTTVGTMTVEFGPHTFNTGTSTLTANGAINVDDDGTFIFGGGLLRALPITGMRVGRDASGQFVQNGGTVDIEQNMYVGTNAGSYGKYELNDGVLQVSDNLRIGYAGTGDFVQNGGEVHVATVFIGDLEGSTGNYGMYSGTTTVTSLIVGVLGTGWLTVADGGSVSTSTARIGNFGTGTVLITGVDSTATINGGSFIIGSNGTGTLVIENGGNVSNGAAYVGVGDGSRGTAIVTGSDSNWTNSGDLTIADAGNGMITIDYGGRVSNVNGRIGSFGDGTATVRGGGSTWNHSEEITVGSEFGTGMLTIEDGGNVSSGNAFVGRLAGSTGTATVTGDGSTWLVSGVLNIGGDPFAGGAGGAGTVTIDPGGTLIAEAGVMLFPEGDLRLQGGELATFGLDAGEGQFEWTAGKLNVDVYLGSLLNSGGTLAAGHLLPSTTINGNYTQQAAAALEIEIGNTGFDQVIIDGLAQLAGTLNVSLIDGFTPSIGQQFAVLSSYCSTGPCIVNNGLTLGGAAASLFDLIVGDSSVILQAIAAQLPGDFNYDGTVDAADYVAWRNTGGTSQQYADWRANFGRTAGAGATTSPTGSANLAVPEPATLLLPLAAVGTVTCRRLRRGWVTAIRGRTW